MSFTIISYHVSEYTTSSDTHAVTICVCVHCFNNYFNHFCCSCLRFVLIYLFVCFCFCFCLSVLFTTNCHTTERTASALAHISIVNMCGHCFHNSFDSSRYPSSPLIFSCPFHCFHCVSLYVCMFVLVCFYFTVVKCHIHDSSTSIFASIWIVDMCLDCFHDNLNSSCCSRPCLVLSYKIIIMLCFLF